MRDGTILLVEDDAPQRALLGKFLEARGFSIEGVGDVAGAREALTRFTPGLVLTDYDLPDGDGLEVLRAVREQDARTGIVMITAYGTVPLAVEAMREGAVDFMLKPADPDVLLQVVQRSLRMRSLETENERLRRRLGEEVARTNLVAGSPPMQEVMRLVHRIAATWATVLITGESGTGKELVANLLHEWGPAPEGPFVATNCAALPETLLESELFGHTQGSFTGAIADRKGRFEEADGGTLFLDEIGEIPLSVQTRLLRVLQEREIVRVGENVPRPIHVRLVAATNKDLEAEVKAGRFREDLFYRIHVVRVHLPPLRERMDDLPELIARFTEECARRNGLPPLPFADAAMSALAAHPFPGNVRELLNVVERALLLAPGDHVQVEDLPPAVRGGSEAGASPPADPQGLDEATARLEQRMIREALARTGGVQTRAAALLGIAERVLRYKMKKHDITREGGTPGA